MKTPHFIENDTIAALATPSGVGGIAVIRISGDNALICALSLLEIDRLKPRYAHFSSIHTSEGTLLDTVVATYFKAPFSYTGDDTVEISCHGGFTAAPAILDLCYQNGARPALPGEYTKRAFLNGKLDLIQAEAVGDLIHSRSSSAHLAATRALEGELSLKIKSMKNALMDIAAILELELDFVEQEINTVPRHEHLEKMKSAQRQISDLIATYESGKIQREGALVPIVGKPNAGKSSILNGLLQEDRAIISQIPGTTRDTIEESFQYDSLSFRLVDTAGLRDSDDPIEMLGTERAKKLLEEADIICLVSDLSDRDPSFETFISTEYRKTPLLHVFNKKDLVEKYPVDTGSKQAFCVVSAKNHQGLDVLKRKLAELTRDTFRISSDSVALSKKRHKQSLVLANDALQRAIDACENNLSNEFIAMDVRESLAHMDDITGETTSEDVLNRIFDQFCIGK